MGSINQELKRKLESLSCPTHGERPNVTVKPGGVSYTACCEEFGQRIQSEMDAYVDRAVNKGLERELDKMFR